MTAPDHAEFGCAHWPADRDGLHWLFAYGSLIWEPGFTPDQSAPAVLAGWRRGFYGVDLGMRDQAGNTGLTLAILADPEAHTTGLALAVAPSRHLDILAALRAREAQPIAPIYQETLLPVTLLDGRRITAIAYTTHGTMPGFAGATRRPAEAAAIIATTRTRWGSSFDYLASTVESLRALGTPDPALEELLELARAQD